MLGVHVQHFQNLYNAEFRNSKDYCCCDISYKDVPCVATLTDLNVAACTSECEPYFEMRFEVCFADGTCSNMKNEAAVIDNILSICISPLLVQLHSKEPMIDNITSVSAREKNSNTRVCILLIVHLLIRQHCMWMYGIVEQTQVVMIISLTTLKLQFLGQYPIVSISPTHSLFKANMELEI